MDANQAVAKISLPFYIIKNHAKKVYYGENHFSRYYLKSPRFLVFIYKKNLGFTTNPIPGYKPLNPILNPENYLQELKTVLNMIKYSANNILFSLSIKSILKYVLGYLVGFGKDRPYMKADQYSVEIRNASYYAERVLELKPDSLLYIRGTLWLNIELTIDTGKDGITAWIKEDINKEGRRYRILELIINKNEQARREVDGLIYGSE